MIDHAIDETERLISVRISGKSTDTDLILFFSQLLQNPKFEQTSNLLFLFSEDATLPALLVQQQLDRFLEGLAIRQQGTKWAFVSSNRTQLALTQLATENLNLGSVELQLFDAEHAARLWLTSGTPPPASPD